MTAHTRSTIQASSPRTAIKEDNKLPSESLPKQDFRMTLQAVRNGASSVE
jgi:hypothetical protein